MLHHEARLWMPTENTVERLGLTAAPRQALPGYCLSWGPLRLPSHLRYNERTQGLMDIGPFLPILMMFSLTV